MGWKRGLRKNMDSFEWNKIIGAVLASLLLVRVIGIIGNVLVHPKMLAKNAFEVAIAAPSASKTGPTQTAAAKPSLPLLLANASAAKGKQIAAVCGTCHSFKKGAPNKFGPNLWGIVGSKPGTVPNYSFSKAMKHKPGTWTYAALFQFLKDPQKVVVGTKMPFQGLPSAKQRADVIAFLRTLNDHPLPLPKVVKTAAATTAPAKAATPASPAATIDQLLPKASAAKGKQIAAVCGTCHSFKKGAPNKFGPNLWGVVGSKPGTVPNYSFSEAMKHKPGMWTYAALFQFLKDPQKVVVGTKMPFQGLPSAKQRADVIAFLRTLSDHPEPLPKAK
jgi:cytochrome c